MKINFEDLDNIMYTTLKKYEKYASNKYLGDIDEWVLKVENIKSVGLCSYEKKEITINKWHAENSPEESILDTLLHEVAHALCGLERSRTGRIMGHGALWKSWARELGATPKATVPLSELGDGAKENFTKNKRKPKYYIVYLKDDIVEIVGQCSKKLTRIGDRYIKGRRETLGKLWLVPVEKYTNDTTIIAKKLIR